MYAPNVLLNLSHILWLRCAVYYKKIGLKVIEYGQEKNIITNCIPINEP